MDGTELINPAAEHQARQEPTPIGTRLKDQANRFRIVEEEQRRFRPIIYWYLSFRCNLACAHCSVHSSPWVDTSEDLTTEECLKVVDQMAELNIRAALLTGGEFLIRPDAMQILRALMARGIGTSIETNGLHYPPGFVELALELHAKRLFAMTISLDGGTQETHERLRGPRSFERTVNGLRFLKENHVPFVVQCVLNSSNIGTISNLYTLAQELTPECGYVQWAILNPVGRGTGLVHELGLKPRHINQMFESIKANRDTYSGTTIIKVPPAMVPPKFIPMVFKDGRVKTTTTCQFPLLGVLPNGDVTVCALSRDNQELHFGNVRDESLRLKSIWEKTRMEMLRSRYVSADDLQGICGDCVWKYACKGGCRAWAYEEGGDFDAPFPICREMEETGAFPTVYRLSHQNAAAIAQFQQLQAGCGCST